MAKQVKRESTNAQVDQKLTDTQIKKLKAQHGQLYLVEVEGEEQIHQFVFKMPSRNVISASAKVIEDDPIQSTEIVLENCIVYGDRKLFEDMSIFQAIGKHLHTIVQSRESTIKKL